MEPSFEGLTESEMDYLRYLQKQGYFDGFEMTLSLDSSSDYRIDKFLQEGYITFDGPGPYDGCEKINITGKGLAALTDYDKFIKNNRKNKIKSAFAWIIGTAIGITGLVIAYLQLIKP